MSENLPVSLLQLQAACDAGNAEAIRAFYQACNVLSGNEDLLAYSQEYGFPTVVIDAPPANGQRLMVGRDLAQLTYNRTDTSGLRKLLSRYGIDFLTIGAFGHDVQMLLRQTFHLDQFDGRTIFATYGHFMVVSMHGQTEQSRKVRANIYQTATYARVDRKVKEMTGLHADDLEAALASPGEDPELMKLEILRQQRLEQLAQRKDIQQLQAANEDRKEETEALEARAEALEQRNQDLEAQLQQVSSQADLALNAAQDDVTLEEFVRTRNLYRQLPPSHWRGPYPRWLKDYSRENNLRVDKKRVYGKPWDHELTYKLQALYALQREMLHHPEQFDMDLDDERSA